MKQNRYPILFLTQGITERYPTYADPRCHTIQNAVYHATCHDFLVNFLILFSIYKSYTIYILAYYFIYLHNNNYHYLSCM